MNIGNRTAYYGRECFVFMHNFIRIVIPFEKDENVLVDDTGNVLENVTENVLENSASLGEKLAVTGRTIRRDLAQLQELGYIRHIGPDKGGRWQVLKTINNKKK